MFIEETVADSDLIVSILFFLVENCSLIGPLGNRLTAMLFDREYPPALFRNVSSMHLFSPPPFEKVRLLYNRDARGYTLRGRELEVIYKSRLQPNNMNKPLRIIQLQQVN